MGSRSSSSYYPPRAGLNRHFNQISYAVRRRLHLEQLGLKLKTTPSRFFFGLIVPGFSFLDAGWGTMGKATMIGWTLAALVFLIWLGYAAANIAFGLMMSMHVSSILYLHNRAFPEMPVLRRLMFSIMVLLIVGQVVYVSGLKLCQSYVFMPLRVGEKTYVINRLGDPGTLRRGDFVACHAEATSADSVRIREGYILNKVIAVPGDRIDFKPGQFAVNGVLYTDLPRMPESGTTVLDQHTWLVWPSLETVVKMNVNPQSVSAAVLKMAKIERGQVIGKPFRRWFFRKQIA